MTLLHREKRFLSKDNSMKKVIIIHGYTSSPQRKKYRIISEKLHTLGVECAIPALPGGEHPHSSEWLALIDKEVRNTDKPVILVGHSLGTRAALLYLDRFDRKVDAVILISAFNNNVKENRNRKDGDYADFFDYSVDIDKIKKLANKFIVAHSRDDDALDYHQGVEISKELGAQLVTYENMGHFGGEERAEANAEAFLKLIKSVL
jgi:predicted alpha/beta hydrolase family esterase